MNWGPEWLVLPSGAALHKPSMHPKCGDCGETIFTYYEAAVAVAAESGGGETSGLNEDLTLRSGRVVCPRCVRPKPGEILKGHVDCVRKRFLSPAPIRREGHSRG